MALDLIVQSFNAGELSPHLDGRSDLEKYYSGCRLLENMIPLPYGDAERRPGTYFVAETKHSAAGEDKKSRLVPFQYSTEQAYIHELGEEYIRFYKDRGQILTGAGTENLSALSANLIAHWKLNDDAADTDVDDAVGVVPHDGTATSNTNTLHETGKVGTGCFNLNGVDAVEVTDHADFTFIEGANGDFSIIAWVYIARTGGNGSILTKWKEDHFEWAFGVNADNRLKFYTADDSQCIFPIIMITPSCTSDEPLSTGWHLVGVTYNGEHGSWTGATAADYMTLYVDGVAVDSTATNKATYVTMENKDAPVWIGAWDVGGSPSDIWSDKIDNVAIFKKTLSAAEMAALYSTTAYEITSSYLEADLFGLQWAQSADVLYNVHSDYPPTKLMRYAHDDWEIEDIVFDWPPFLKENDTDTTITITDGAAPIAVGGSVTLTASTPIFTNNHIGSYWLIKHERGAEDANNPNVKRKKFTAIEQTSGYLIDVKGIWHFRTTGAWTGRIVVERRYDGGDWHTLGDAFESETANPQNFNVSGNEEVDGADYRMRTLTLPAWADNCMANISVERFYHYGIVKITAFTNSTTVTAEVIRELQVKSATEMWCEGAWSDERGYPVTVAFYEGRQWYAGTSYRPLNIWGGKVQDYENMKVGTLDDDPVSYTVDAGMQNMIRWLVGQEVLLIGTSGGEWKLGSVDPSDAITPTNPIKPRIQTTYGSAEIQAILLANVVLFVDAQGRAVRGAQYIFEQGEAGKYDAPPYTMLAEHITESGIVDMAYQQNPYPILWCVRDDGVLVGMVFEPGQKVWGWFRCVIDGDVESVAIIRGVTEDEVWIIVKREIDGETKRYIEYFKPRDWGDDQADCFFVDSGLSFDGGAAVTITGITKANPGVVTVDTWPTDGDGNNLADGDQIKICDVVGMTELNNKIFSVSNPNVSAKTFELRDKLDTVDWDSTGHTLYDSGGTVQKVDNAFSGLDHLEGETVSVLGDGSVHADVVVSSGEITLTDYFNIVHVGLPYESPLMPMKLEFPTRSGTARAKVKRVHSAVFSFYNTLGCEFGGLNEDGTPNITERIPFRKTTDPMGSAPPLFTGEKLVTFPGNYGLEGNIYVTQRQPLPLTVRSITARLKLYG